MGPGNKCAEPRTLTSWQLASSATARPTRLLIVLLLGGKKIIVGPYFRLINRPVLFLAFPVLPPSPGRVTSPSGSWRITLLSSLLAFSLTAPLPLPPPNLTSFTSFASRLFQLGHFPNPLPRCMLPRPKTLPTSPTHSTPTLPARRRPQSFVHSFRSTSPRTKTSTPASFCLRLTQQLPQQVNKTFFRKWSPRYSVVVLIPPYLQTPTYDIAPYAAVLS